LPKDDIDETILALAREAVAARMDSGEPPEWMGGQDRAKWLIERELNESGFVPKPPIQSPGAALPLNTDRLTNAAAKPFGPNARINRRELTEILRHELGGPAQGVSEPT